MSSRVRLRAKEGAQTGARQKHDKQGKSHKNNFLMTLGKAKSKGKRSLVETRRVLKPIMKGE
jgi:protein SDA1